jgi:hypothetical protein
LVRIARRRKERGRKKKASAETQSGFNIWEERRGLTLVDLDDVLPDDSTGSTVEMSAINERERRE